MSARLLYVMDPMCSWCWGFAPVATALREQAAAAGVATDVVVGGLRSAIAPLEPATQRYILEHWQAVAEATGQTFNFSGALPATFVYNTEPACRALVAARQLDATLVWPLLELLQPAFYVQGLDITQPAILLDLAEQAGLPRAEFAAAFDSRELRDATAVDVGWARQLGISGFPTLLAERNGQMALLTNGYRSHAELTDLLGRWLAHATHADS